MLVAVADLAAAARDFEARFGLASVPGGRHPGWGTANRIVPLGDTYLELVTVDDETEARGNLFGQWVSGAVVDRPRPLGWAVRTTELEPIAARLGLVAQTGSRRTADGAVLHWHTAGLERAAAEPSLPFFIEWSRETGFPGAAEVPHRAERPRISKLILTGERSRLDEWLGDHRLPIEVRAGEPAVAAVVVATGTGEVVVRG